MLKENIMFQQYFKRHSRVQALREGSGGPLLERFTEELYQEGYAEEPPASTSVRRSMLFIGRIEKAYRSQVRSKTILSVSTATWLDADARAMHTPTD